MTGCSAQLRRPIRGLAALAAASGAMWLGMGATGIATGTASAGPVGCGFHLGATHSDAALGSLVLVVPVVPNDPRQSCTTSVTATASIATTGGVRPGNVTNNPRTSTATVSFRPNQLPPDISWEWSPHCADPSSLALVFTATSPNGGTSQMPLPSESCSDFGSTTPTIAAPLIFSPNPGSVVGIAPTPGNLGYWTAALSGFESAYGNASILEQPPNNAPIVGLVAAGSPSAAWWASADGGVFALGSAPFYGSMGGTPLSSPVVGITATPDHGGYWLVAADGGVFAFGDAGFYGSMGGHPLNQPVVGMAPSPDGHGYWLVAADGGIFAFGDAGFHGSMGGSALNAPVTGMAANGTGGYWLVATDGGIFTFDATFFGSLGGIGLNAPISGIAATSDGNGYWLVGADEGVFAFGDAPFHGSGPLTD